MPAEEGLRERNKREKLERIKAAARALFAEKGFEATTTREVSQRAGVGTGTLFLYVRDKHDLLVLVFKDQVERLQAGAFAALPDGPLIERLVFIFEQFYDYYALEPALSRVFVKELMFLREGQWEEMARVDEAFFARLAGLVGEAQARGELRSEIDPMLAVGNFFSVYCMLLIGWLGGRIPTRELQRGMLRAMLELQVRGLGAPQTAAGAGRPVSQG
jgi:AcrR family transcriptional regulator